MSCLLVETVRAFTHVINQGWAMYWGSSRWSPTEIMVGKVHVLGILAGLPRESWWVKSMYWGSSRWSPTGIIVGKVYVLGILSLVSHGNHCG